MLMAVRSVRATATVRRASSLIAPDGAIDAKVVPLPRHAIENPGAPWSGEANQGSDVYTECPKAFPGSGLSHVRAATGPA
jgi:hypothetical protein